MFYGGEEMMKKMLKRTIAIGLSVALAVTGVKADGICKVKADDQKEVRSETKITAQQKKGSRKRGQRNLRKIRANKREKRKEQKRNGSKRDKEFKNCKFNNIFIK